MYNYANERWEEAVCLCHIQTTFLAVENSLAVRNIENEIFMIKLNGIDINI